MYLKKITLLLFNFTLTLFANSYTISICSTPSYESAVECKKKYLKNPIADSYIIELDNTNFKAVYGKFPSIDEAKKFRNTLPREYRDNIQDLSIIPLDLSHIATEVKKDVIKTTVLQKKIEPTPTIAQIAQKKSIDSNASISESLLIPLIIKEKVTLNKKKVEEINATIEFNELNSSIKALVSKSTICTQALFEELSNPKSFDQVILEITSATHNLKVYGISKKNRIFLKNYVVSTARKNIKQPLGEGKISAISINPIWYPTEETIENFRDKKGVDLPSSVLPGSPLNYMGLAKINLTHIVDGKNTYRIHGTLNEKTIGTNESSGCIRMKNKEVLELAQFLKIFASLKSFQNIHVFIR